MSALSNAVSRFRPPLEPVRQPVAAPPSLEPSEEGLGACPREGESRPEKLGVVALSECRPVTDANLHYNCKLDGVMELSTHPDSPTMTPFLVRYMGVPRASDRPYQAQREHQEAQEGHHREVMCAAWPATARAAC